MFSNVLETPAVNQTAFVILDQVTKIVPVRYSNVQAIKIIWFSVTKSFQSNCRKGCPCEFFECQDVPTTPLTTTLTSTNSTTIPADPTIVSTTMMTTSEGGTTNAGWILK